MKKLIMTLTAICLTTVMLAQNTSDALRYSRVFYGGTARFQGLGGAFGALGADFSVLQTNPAGIGIYRSSEISIGPSLLFNNTESEYMGTVSSDGRFRGGLSNVGFVFTIKSAGDSKLKNFNVGFGINKQTNFNNRIYINGANNESSILTDWADILNTTSFLTPDQIRDQFPFDIALAYDANLLFEDQNGYYTSDVEYGGVIQTKTVTSRGSLNEFDISLGGNFDDKVYFGATLGIPYLRYFETSTYRETSDNNSIQHFESMVYAQELETYGTGVNLKLGVIVRPANWVRIGAAVHTPTWFGSMRDNWDSYIESTFYDSTGNSYVESPLGEFDYQMSTPFRAIGSVAFLFGTVGLISAEYEYVDYGTAKFYDRDDDNNETYRGLNDDINASYGSPLNLRVGTEWALDVLRVRGGVGYYGSPYGDGDKGSRLAISGGVGYRGKHFFTDVSYVWSKTNDDYYLYSPIFVDPAKINTIGNVVTATFGIRF